MFYVHLIYFFSRPGIRQFFSEVLATFGRKWNFKTTYIEFSFIQAYLSVTFIFISFYFDAILAKSIPTYHKIFLDIKANCNNHECRRSMNILFQIHQNLDFSNISSTYPCLWYLSWVRYSFAIISTLLDSIFIFNPFHTILVLLSLGLGNPFCFHVNLTESQPDKLG